MNLNQTAISFFQMVQEETEKEINIMKLVNEIKEPGKEELELLVIFKDDSVGRVKVKPDRTKGIRIMIETD